MELAGCVDVELGLHDLSLDGGREHGLHDEGEEVDPGLDRAQRELVSIIRSLGIIITTTIITVTITIIIIIAITVKITV